MNSSPEPTTSANEGGERQTDNGTRANTAPVRRTVGGLTLPKISKAATSRKASIGLGSHAIVDSEPRSGSSSEDGIMNERHLKKSMPGIMREDNETRRTAGKQLWYHFSASDEEGPEDVSETSSAVTKPLPFRPRALTRSSGVSKPPQSGSFRRNTNEGPRMTVRRSSGGGGTRLGLRSQTTGSSQPNAETSPGAEETAGGLAGGVGRMSIDDQRM